MFNPLYSLFINSTELLTINEEEIKMEWKQIIIDKNKTNYAVSNDGRVKNLKTNYELTCQQQQGYMHITLSIN